MPLLRASESAAFKRESCLYCKVAALEDSLRSRSALLKHEVAYVLGQVQDPAAVDALEYALCVDPPDGSVGAGA